MNAEERSLRNGGRFPAQPIGRDPKPKPEPWPLVPCSNLRPHEPHIWVLARNPSVGHACPGKETNDVD